MSPFDKIDPNASLSFETRRPATAPLAAAVEWKPDRYEEMNLQNPVLRDRTLERARYRLVRELVDMLEKQLEMHEVEDMSSTQTVWRMSIDIYDVGRAHNLLKRAETEQRHAVTARTQAHTERKRAQAIYDEIEWAQVVDDFGNVVEKKL